VPTHLAALVSQARTLVHAIRSDRSTSPVEYRMKRVRIDTALKG
jgi:hypothetical protein